MRVYYQGQIQDFAKARGGTQVLEIIPQCAKHTLRNAKHELSRGVWGHAAPGNFEKLTF